MNLYMAFLRKNLQFETCRGWERKSNEKQKMDSMVYFDSNLHLHGIGTDGADKHSFGCGRRNIQ